MDKNNNSNPAVTVKVSEFRRVIEHLETKINRDYHSCVGSSERANWAAETSRVIAELTGMVCKRATADDMARRERALDRSAKLLSKIGS